MPVATIGGQAHMNTHQPTVRLAVIDSDSGFEKVLARRLEDAGWEYRFFNGPMPLEELASMKLNALLVDLTVLGLVAWEFLDRACSMLPGVGVVVCTQRSTVSERVRGLRLGADDWITKPAHPEEVIARIEAAVRRHRRGNGFAEAGPLVAGEVEVRPDQFQAFVAGKTIDLTRREFELLQVLAESQGRVVEREDLYQRVWGYSMAHGDRSVDVFIRKLRAKLRKASPGWKYIHTHFGVGYRFEAVSRDGAEGSVGRQPAASDAAPEVFSQVFHDLETSG